MVLTMKKWQGKTAVITGASSGIGQCLAEELLKHGLVVVGLARRVERIEEKKLELSGKLHALKCDMTKPEEILEVFQIIEEKFGPIHILINSAGCYIPTTLIDGNIQAWKTMLDTNVMGLSVATREALNNMKKNKVDGHIIHINSFVGHGIPTTISTHMYSASKFALTALTETLRIELRDIDSKIKITGISPGLVNTQMVKNCGFKVESLPMLEAEDVADAVIYALSTPPHVQIHDIRLKAVGGK